ncbi:RNA 2',3'-cyclic phosphodiesterase [Celeribacter halophilus]|uniref:RNA 2',3'-cyclic phosphodiesterase n=1 Tax=Celeribacter halophilus TaxID=576117 RepID=UPI002FD61E9F
MRAFVGLPLPDDLTDRLEALAAPLRFGRAVPAENMHVTLAFLDDRPEDLLAELHEELASLSLPAPEIAVAGLDVFGGGKPRLLFASVTQDEALTALRNKVRQAARAVGIDLPHERFRPHISLPVPPPSREGATGTGPSDRGAGGFCMARLPAAGMCHDRLHPDAGGRAIRHACDLSARVMTPAAPRPSCGKLSAGKSGSAFSRKALGLRTDQQRCVANDP